MKILAFSDLHCDQKIAQEIVAASVSAEIVIGAGDFGAKGRDAADTIDILRAITVPTILVAGNHDYLSDLNRLCANWTNCHVLHGTSITLNGDTFFGLGYEIPSRSDRDWNQTMSEAEAATLLESCPSGAVLVTHTPPFEHCDLQRNGLPEGSHAIRNTIATKQIKLNLCGHIHNSWGASSTLANCPVHNLGPTINWFDI